MRVKISVRSPQTLSEADRRIVAAWAADCAERVLGVFETEAAGDNRPRDAIARARTFARGGLDVAEQIRRRFVGNAAAQEVRIRSGGGCARARPGSGYPSHGCARPGRCRVRCQIRGTGRCGPTGGYKRRDPLASEPHVYRGQEGAIAATAGR